MSTNFYLEKAACEHCGCTPQTPRPVHLGKRFSVGNGDCSFAFRGYEGPGDLMGTIRSVADLRAALPIVERDGWVITDEYGVTYTSKDFFAREVDAIPRGKRGAQFEMAQAQASQWGALGYREFLDPEGFSFTDGEFC